jgi:programmed cell death protein 5
MMDYLTPEQVEQLEELEKMKKVVIGKILTKEAVERLGRIKLVKPELAAQLELYLLQAYQTGEIKTTIDDNRLKQILDVIVKKKNFRIVR